jgi:hypothetical protein
MDRASEVIPGLGWMWPGWPGVLLRKQVAGLIRKLGQFRVMTSEVLCFLFKNCLSLN